MRRFVLVAVSGDASQGVGYDPLNVGDLQKGEKTHDGRGTAPQMEPAATGDSASPRVGAAAAKAMQEVGAVVPQNVQDALGGTNWKDRATGSLAADGGEAHE